MSTKEAITKMQAAIIAIIIIVAVIAGAAYYYTTLPGPTPTPTPTPTPVRPTPTPTPTPTPKPTPPPKDKIVIGVVHTMSGPVAPVCALHHAYYSMIVEDYNAKGGIYVPEYGRRIPIELKAYDDEWSVEKMLLLIERLMTVEKVDLMFAPWGTEFNFAAFPLFEKYKYPVVALTVGSDVICERMKRGEYTYSFITLGPPYETGEEVAEMLTYVNKNISPIRRVGIIFHSAQHGVEYAAAIYRELYIAGFEIPVYEGYPMDITDFTPLITKLKAANVDVVIKAGYEAALFLTACKAQAFNPKLIFCGPTVEVPGLVFGPYGFTPEFLKGVCYYDGWPATAYNTPKLKQWAEDHEKRLGYPPFPASATFYAGLEALFQAVEKVGLNREKIRDALATQSFDTILGKFKLRIGASPQSEVAGTLTQWQGGTMMEVVWPREVASAEIICPKPPWP
ncbi:MAG: ABC transporter substrate-binding protein [Nitrososphaerota archaeon]|nr:ABC transporter substrate-binding protein [Candidatus Bathyarchaeota archaeon]MDW8022713.1 ABC transporter substrate-binding protein [Nitrososphaerota archaeon]